MLRSDRTCVWIGGGVRWGEVMCVDRREVRWGVWIRGLKRSKVEGKLTVGLRLARWSDYHEGSAERWGEVRWCVDRRSKTVKGGRKTHRGFAFGSVIELPWRIGGEVSSAWPGVGWIDVSGWIGGQGGGWALSFSHSLSLLRVTRKWFEGKMKV